ncbi:hypothetical protein [Brevundimonas sp. Root1279]|uniref:hypothetical protein n=1 Tax=Brevundimonas sp. Root1279 TaxID=1736443 RepID=UPI0006F1CE5D|nr:hypothetical protein [Brevundimonas sp. Root1279]KQW79722.1 hypothetical protein ASC65_14330 [Brevundimonas sp. Root1279]
MRIRISHPGIFDGAGKEIEVGTEVDVTTEPKGWEGRYEVVSGKMPPPKDAKTAVTNPAKAKTADTTLKAEHHGGGKFRITQGEEVLLSDLSKADADAFNGLSDEDKAAFVADQKKA